MRASLLAGLSIRVNCPIGFKDVKIQDLTTAIRNRSGRFGGVGKEGASADCAEEMKDTTSVSLWRLHIAGNEAW